MREVLFMEKAENKIIEQINAYKEANEIKLDQKELEVLTAYYEEQNPYTPPQSDQDDVGANGTDDGATDGGTDGAGGTDGGTDGGETEPGGTTDPAGDEG